LERISGLITLSKAIFASAMPRNGFLPFVVAYEAGLCVSKIATWRDRRFA
jgi:hypothetical protein